MITRAMQRSNQGKQTIPSGEPILFNQLIQSWPPSGTSPLPITYSSGTFCIPDVSTSDFLVTWSVSIKTSTKLDGMCNFCLFDMDYGNGAVTEGCSSSSLTATGLLKGYKIIHITRVKRENDYLYFWIKNNSMANAFSLKTPQEEYETANPSLTVYNCNICIVSI